MDLGVGLTWHFLNSPKYIQGKEIEIYNNGNMSRSFTYIDDLINNIYKLISTIPVDSQPLNINDSLSPVAPWRVINIGGNQKIPLMKFIDTLELELGIVAKKIFRFANR